MYLKDELLFNFDEEGLVNIPMSFVIVIVNTPMNEVGQLLPHENAGYP